jgi:tRNA1Val (adenine37-N6)-methyltransferase
VSFGPEDLTCDGFLGGRLRLHQPRKGYRAATDPVLLASFVPARPGERVLDLGCGIGTAGLCLAARVAGIELHGLELQPAYAELARRNAAENGISMTVHEGDLRQPPADLRRTSFDHVLMNPPFYRSGHATAARDTGRDIAHREGEARLEDWIATGLRRLAPRGWLSIIHRTERLGAILAALEPRTGGIVILPLASRTGHPASRVLIRARKSVAESLRLCFPLVVHQGERHAGDSDNYTESVRKILTGDPMDLRH